MITAEEAKLKSMSSEANKKTEEAARACLREIEGAILRAAEGGHFKIHLGGSENIWGGAADPHVRLASLLYFLVLPSAQRASGMEDLHVVDKDHLQKIVSFKLEACGFTLPQRDPSDLVISWEL